MGAMKEYPIDAFGIDFIACDCTVWPIVRLHGVGRCGRCGVRPDHELQPERLIGRKEDGMTLEQAREQWQRTRRR